MRPGVRARWSLVAAGVLAGLGVLAVALAGWPVGGAAALPVASGVAAGCVLAGVLAGEVPPLRRTAVAVLARSAGAAAVGLAAALGLVTTLLVLGRLPVGAERGLAAPLLAGTVVAAVLAGPLARRAARTARAVLHGTRRSPDELLAAFADGSAEGADAEDDDLLRRLAESLRREHRLARVEIWSAPRSDALADGGAALHRVVTVPARPGEPAPAPLDEAELALLTRAGVAGSGWLRLWLPRLLAGRPPDAQLRLAPAVHAGRVLALLVVERTRDADALTGADERALGEVARRLAIVLRNRALDEALAGTLADLRRTNAELQASRARLVSAADAERHEMLLGAVVQVALDAAALAVGLRLVRDGVTSGTGGAADVALLNELDRGVRESISALRDLAHGIYPPLLRDAGLPDALRAAAARSPLPVQVHAAGVGRYPEPVEAAVYFCCLEALQNAAKHAQGAEVTIDVAHRDGRLVVEVADSGPGFAGEEPPSGAGMQNMADRLGAVGGSVRWSSTPGRGTTVTAAVPVAAGAPALPVGG